MPAPAHVSIADMEPGESAASPNSGPCWSYTGECGGAADPDIVPWLCSDQLMLAPVLSACSCNTCERRETTT